MRPGAKSLPLRSARQLTFGRDSISFATASKHNSRMKTVAIIGASNDRNKFGNKAVRAFLQQGFTVYPVNPHESQIEGLRAFKSISDLPERPGMISIYLPPPVLLTILPDI